MTENEFDRLTRTTITSRTGTATGITNANTNTNTNTNGHTNSKTLVTNGIDHLNVTNGTNIANITNVPNIGNKTKLNKSGQVLNGVSKHINNGTNNSNSSNNVRTDRFGNNLNNNNNKYKGKSISKSSSPTLSRNGNYPNHSNGNNNNNNNNNTINGRFYISSQFNRKEKNVVSKGIQTDGNEMYNDNVNVNVKNVNENDLMLAENKINVPESVYSGTSNNTDRNKENRLISTPMGFNIPQADVVRSVVQFLNDVGYTKSAQILANESQLSYTVMHYF